MPLIKDVENLALSDAISLWLKGKDEWNRWVKSNPCYNISFKGVSFAEHLSSGEVCSFVGYQFPDGSVDFSGADFGDGDVSFAGTNFGNGSVYFRNTQFKNGKVDFSRAYFGSSMPKSVILFDDANFGDGDVSFVGTTFGDGYVGFSGAGFADGVVDFTKSRFGKGIVRFVEAKFINADVYFDEVNFGGEEVNFSKAIFGGKEFYFKSVESLELKLYFTWCDFGDCKVSIENTSVKDLMLSEVNCSSVKVFTLCNANIGQTLDFSGSEFGCVVDIRNAVLNSVNLDGIRCQVARAKSKKWPHFSMATNNRDIANTRRLKKIAEENKNHEAALHFHALEMRSKRWIRFGKRASLLDWMFDCACDYGQSILKPLEIFILVSLGYTHFYYVFLTKLSGDILRILVFSFSNNPLFASFSKGSKKEVLEMIFGKGNAVPGWIDLLFLSQNLLSIVLIFLIILGLRNRFRI